MKIIKLIAGMGCLVLALGFFLMALGAGAWFGDVNLAAIIFAAIFTCAGWLLISKRKSPLSIGGRILTVSFFLFLVLWMVAIVIPDFLFMSYSGPQNSCVNNLRQLEAAKQEWALETGATNGTLVTATDLTPYVQLDSHGNLPRCPAGGTYIFGRVGEDVKCSIGTSDWPYSHTLSETNDFTRWENFKEAYATLFGFRHIREGND
jgi:hypothetical protein